MSEIERAQLDRRSTKDRRKKFKLSHFFYRGEERRSFQERRSRSEKRNNWVRISKWSSVHLPNLKITKYLN